MLRKIKTTWSSVDLRSSMKMLHAHPLVRKRVLFGKPPHPKARWVGAG